MGSENLGGRKGFCVTPLVSVVFGPGPCTCSLALMVNLHIFSSCPDLCPLCPESLLGFQCCNLCAVQNFVSVF